MARTKLFRSNRSQAVRLPKEVAFPEGVKDVTIIREGARRVIVPANAVWDDFSMRQASICRRASNRQHKSATRSDAALPTRYQSVHSGL